MPGSASGARSVPGHSGGGVIPSSMKCAVGAEAKRNPKEISLVARFGPEASPRSPMWKVPRSVLPLGRSPSGKGPSALVPCGPWGPRGPSAPSSPGSPSAPGGPCGPADPARPCGPANPRGPLRPRGPRGPRSGLCAAGFADVERTAPAALPTPVLSAPVAASPSEVAPSTETTSAVDEKTMAKRFMAFPCLGFEISCETRSRVVLARRFPPRQAACRSSNRERRV